MDAATNSKRGGKGTTEGLVGDGKPQAETLTDKARDVADKARQIAATAAERADDAAAAVGGQVRSLAGVMEHRGPEAGTFGTASAAVAGYLDETGRYMEEQGLSGAIDDLGTLIRRNPLPAVLVGFGVGFLLAKLTQRD